MRSYIITLAILLLIAPVIAQDIIIENDTVSDSDTLGTADQAGEFVTGTKTGFRALVENGFTGDSALLLISGGLFILLFVVPLAMINSLFWKKRTSDVHGFMSQPRPTFNIGQKYDIGYNTGFSLKPQSVDDIIDTLKYLEDVEIKIVNSTTTYKRIKVKGCRSCTGKSSKKPVCEFERGFFAGAFSNLYKSVDVKETACKADGSSSCEFEIKIKR